MLVTRYCECYYAETVYWEWAKKKKKKICSAIWRVWISGAMATLRSGKQKMDWFRFRIRTSMHLKRSPDCLNIVNDPPLSIRKLFSALMAPTYFTMTPPLGSNCERVNRDAPDIIFTRGLNILLKSQQWLILKRHQCCCWVNLHVHIVCDFFFFF